MRPTVRRRCSGLRPRGLSLRHEAVLGDGPLVGMSLGVRRKRASPSLEKATTAAQVEKSKRPHKNELNQYLTPYKPRMSGWW